MDGKLLFFAALIGVALWVVRHAAQDDRVEGMAIGRVLCAVWLWCAMPWIYEPLSPAGLIYRGGGTFITHEQTWAFADMIGSVAVLLLGRDRWCAWIIWACFIGMLLSHLVRAMLDVPNEAYQAGLDAAFVAQLAVLFLLGEGGVRARLSRGVARLRRAFLSRVAPHLEA